MAVYERTRAGAHPGRAGGALDVPGLLTRWRAQELSRAQRLRECGGASLAEVQELYDATVMALISREQRYASEEHLRHALREGVRLRALRLHRDRATRAKVLAKAAPLLHGEGQERAWRSQPERAALARQDDELAGEFIAELSALERKVFALVAEGRSWRAIATALAIPETTARSATRSCERKRKRFVTLYETGRLCGYRSHTIELLLAGESDSEQALAQAKAHLRHCRRCRAEHRASAASVQRLFEQRALALAAPAAACGGLWRLRVAGWRAVRLAQRLPSPQGGVRERALEAASGTGLGAKLVAGAISAALLAGAAAGVSGGLQAHHHDRQRHAQVTRPSGAARSTEAAAEGAAQKARPSGGAQQPRRHARRHAIRQRTPGGFSYLGAGEAASSPAQGTSVPPPVFPPAASAATTPPKPAVSQHGGGPFGP
ncbi:MAG: RNA polymerase sigma factor [Solirubrobacteraceae bacterium]